MNIVLDITNFHLSNIIFLENKRNIIMDGTFSKIIYTNANISLNSIYFYFPIETAGPIIFRASTQLRTAGGADYFGWCCSA